MTTGKRLFAISSVTVIPVFAAAVVACVTLGVAVCGRAGPLDCSDVDAEAKWLTHIDFDAGKSTKVGLQVYRRWLSRGLAQRTLQEVRRTIGLDLLEDVRGITFYATRYKRFAAVVIIRAKVDRARLLQILDDNATHETKLYGKHELHTWVQKIEGHKSEISGCFYRPDMVVLGRKAGDVQTALDVLDGKKANLTDSRSALKRPTPEGVVITAGAVELSEATGKKIRFVSPIIRNCRAVFLDCGENGEEVYVQLQLHAETAEIAAGIRDVINGLRAMVKLERSADSHLCNALDALQLTVEDAKLTIDWRMPGPETMRLIEKEWHKQHRKQ